MKVLAVLIGAYLLGSVSTGYIVFRLGRKKDIRSFGSRSTGATNVFRVSGWKYALPVLLGDVLKSVVPVWLALRFSPDRRLALGVALAVALGHCFPVYLRFRGGKGVSTAMGAYLVLAPPLFGICLAVFAGIIAATRFVSLGSLLATLSFPLLALFWKGDRQLALLGAAVFFLVAFRHAGNIRRLLKGRERRLGEKQGA